MSGQAAWRHGPQAEVRMELQKSNIHMNRLKGKVTSQLTLDEDFNLPEMKPDLARIIMQQAEIQLEASKPMEDKAAVKGKLVFSLLYSPEEGEIPEQFAGAVPFEETLNFDGLELQDHLQVKWDIEDLTLTAVNSRKLRANAIVTLEVNADRLYDEVAAQEVTDAGELQTLTKRLEVLQMEVQKRDSFRVKEEIELTSNNPNIRQILWNSLELRNVECKPEDEKLTLRGELVLFAIYSGEEDHIPLQWMEKSILISGEVECPGCRSGMVSSTRISLGHKEIEARPDYDGENRVISVDAVLDLDIRLFEEGWVQLLCDLYQPGKKAVPKMKEAYFRSLLVKNGAKCKVVDQMKAAGEDKILQICHSSGSVKIDSAELVEDGLKVEGALVLQILYMSDDDKEPLRSLEGAVPFSDVVEARGIGPDCLWEMNPVIEQLTTVMLGNDEIEVKASLNLDTLVQRNCKENVVTDVEFQPMTPEELEQTPGIIGYIVRPEDSLWTVAKRFSTTKEIVLQTNGLATDALKPGQRLLLVKQGEEL